MPDAGVRALIFLTGGFFDATFLESGFFAATLFSAGFFSAAFFAVAFFAGVFFTAAFFTAPFFMVAFFTVAFAGTALRATGRLDAGFPTAAALAPFRAAALRAAGADLVAFGRAFGRAFGADFLVVVRVAVVAARRGAVCAAGALRLAMTASFRLP